MQVTRTETGAFVVSGIEPPLDLLLKAIPAAADPTGSDTAARRLHPSPSDDPAAAALRDEWREFVSPELREWFQGALSTVGEDLFALDENGRFTIPPENVESWLNALNQARLALAARHDVTESDMEEPVGHRLEDARNLALFQIHLYGFLQECLIRGLESGEEE